MLQAFRSYAAFPDFAKEVTKDWWSEHIADFYQRIPFDGLWIVSLVPIFETSF